MRGRTFVMLRFFAVAWRSRKSVRGCSFRDVYDIEQWHGGAQHATSSMKHGPQPRGGRAAPPTHILVVLHV